MGIRIEKHLGFGKNVVANLNFAIGNIVVDEAPLISWTDRVYDTEYLSPYSCLPIEKQCVILDIFHPPLDKNTPAIVMFRTQEMSSAKRHVDQSIDLIHKLLVIVGTTCHQHYCVVEDYAETICASASARWKGKKRSAALFEVGSKVAHSCWPTR